jgi:hypothetical protein
MKANNNIETLEEKNRIHKREATQYKSTLEELS